MMEVQKYLIANGLEQLQKEFFIVVTDYPDRVVLNYNQIESPRFHPVVDECRALILKKGTWEVMARSFDRFFNINEGVQQGEGITIDTQRIASFQPYETKTFIITDATILEKLDGSLMSLYWDGEKWCVSTRKLAFAEGQTNLGRTFSEVFWGELKKHKLFIELIEQQENMREFTFVFELTGPENRVVTPYDKAGVTLIGARNNLESYGFRELSNTELDNLATYYELKRPVVYKCENYEKLLQTVKAFPTMQEGVVLVIEKEMGSHWRIKLKNPSYLAIAHLRGNGQISPYRILSLIMTGEHAEYLSYFDCDRPYFNFVEAEYIDVVARIKRIYNENIAIKEQKEFALTIMPKTVYSFEKGVIFTLRKSGGTAEEHLNAMGGKKIALGMNLKQKFIEKFHVSVEEEGEEK